MSKELEVLAEKLRALAKQAEEPWASDRMAFAQSPSYAIVSVYRGTASMIDETLQETADD